MKNITKFFATAVLLAGFNSVFADGRKEAVLDMGKGAFTLIVSVPSTADGPYDFGKNPGIGKAMDGDFQIQEVMFGGKLDESRTAAYKATTQKINPNKQGTRLTAENMAKDQIKANGFEGRAIKFDCPPTQVEGATAVCYKMSGDKIFDGVAKPEKYASVMTAVSWANDTLGYTFMGTVAEKNVERFISDPTFTEKSANKALGQLWNFHKVTKK